MDHIDTIEENFSLYRYIIIYGIVYVFTSAIARRCIFSSLSISCKGRLHRSEQQYISLLKTSECIRLLVIEKSIYCVISNVIKKLELRTITDMCQSNL